MYMNLNINKIKLSCTCHIHLLGMYFWKVQIKHTFMTSPISASRQSLVININKIVSLFVWLN